MFKVFAHKMIIERAAVSGGRQECYGTICGSLVSFIFIFIHFMAIGGPTRESVIFKFETREKYPTNLSPIEFFFLVCLAMTAVVCDNDDVA